MALARPWASSPVLIIKFKKGTKRIFRGRTNDGKGTLTEVPTLQTQSQLLWLQYGPKGSVPHIRCYSPLLRLPRITFSAESV